MTERQPNEDVPEVGINSRSEKKSFASRIKGYWILLVLSLLWGLAFVAIRKADFELSPVNLALLRWFISSGAYLVVLLLLGKPKTRFERKDLPRLLVISLANVPLYHLSLNYAEKSVSSGLAGLLISLGPVFITVLSVYSLKEKISIRIALALILALAGAAILSIGGLGVGSGGLIGPIEVVISAAAYAVFGVLSKPLVKKYGALHIAIWAGVIGTAMLLPLISPSFVTQVETLSLGGWESVLYLSLLSTVLGYSMFFTLVSRGAVSKLSIQLYLIPIISVVGGILLLQEKITLLTLAGGAIMLAAIALATQVRN
ncbi:MAG TPA: DMT family transporter [Nitrososphaerales archaeon]|nr:DMT family transporter [Nitrososphaerales archaeon]